MRVAAIVYDDQSGIVRRVVVSDSVVELGRGQHYGSGESIIVCNPAEVVKFDATSRRTVPMLEECYLLVEEKRGKPSDRERPAAPAEDEGKRR